MGFLTQKINGLKKRWQSYRYGITYLRASGFRIPERLKVNGVRKELSFDRRHVDAFNYEFSEICIEDCYHLFDIGKRLGKVDQIVDIGANQGLFILAARQAFSHAAITGYEPNYQLKPLLNKNIQALNATCYYEAVTRQSCMVTLNFTENDLETVTKVSTEGNVPGTALSEVIDRCGGQIDILKMDCEGAEWDLLEEKDLWKKVRSITMEYHLWAKPGMTKETLQKRMQELGFEVLYISPLSDSFGLLTAVRNR